MCYGLYGIIVSLKVKTLYRCFRMGNIGICIAFILMAIVSFFSTIGAKNNLLINESCMNNPHFKNLNNYDETNLNIYCHDTCPCSLNFQTTTNGIVYLNSIYTILAGSSVLTVSDCFAYQGNENTVFFSFMQ